MADQFAIGIHYHDPAHTDNPEIAALVHLQAIGIAIAEFGMWLGVEEEFSRTCCSSVVIWRIRYDDWSVDVRLSNVQGSLIVRKLHAVWKSQLLRDEADFAIAIEQIDAGEVDLSSWAIFPLRKPIGRIGEVDAPCASNRKVVGTVEALAFKIVHEGAFSLAEGHNRKAAIAVLAGNQSSLVIDG